MKLLDTLDVGFTSLAEMELDIKELSKDTTNAGDRRKCPEDLDRTRIDISLVIFALMGLSRGRIDRIEVCLERSPVREPITPLLQLLCSKTLFGT